MLVTFVLAALALADPPSQDKAAAAAATPAKPADAVVSGVMVNGARAQVETSIDRRSYSVANDLNATTGSIADVLRDIPSVQVDVEGSNLSLRGDANVTVLVDGKPSSQFQGASLATALQTLPASRIDRIEVITNPSAEFRADGSAGIINLIMKKAKGAGHTGSVRIQSGSNGRATLALTTGYNTDRLSVTGYAAYVYQHPRETSDPRQAEPYPNPPHGLDHIDDPTRGEISIAAEQGYIGADYDLDARTRLTGQVTVMHLGEKLLYGDRFVEEDDTGNLTSAFDRLSPGRISQTNGDVSLILRHKWADGHDLTLDATYGDSEMTNERRDDIRTTLPAVGAQSDEIDLANFNRRSNLTADYERSLGADQLKLGYDFEYRDSFVEHAGGAGAPGSPIAYDPAQSDHFADDETDNQAYVTYQHPFGKLIALAGLRGEAVDRALNQVTQAIRSGQTYERFYPTLHLAYDLGVGKRLTASYSKRIARPQPGQLDPFVYQAGTNTIREGNPDLTPQETDSYELAFEARKDPADFLATFYYRQTDNLFSTLYTNEPNDVLLEQSANAGAQRNGGLELVLANRLTPKLTYNLSADAYYTEVSAPNLGFTQTQAAFTGFGRANLNWQATPKDFLQFNVFANGKALVPQGYTAPTYSGNIGYRHTINSKVSWMVVAQDPFRTLKYKTVLDAFGDRDVRTQELNSRMISVTLVWNLAGKPQPQNFDFTPGGNAGG